MDKACYIPSITLAGAAEEILGKMLSPDRAAVTQLSHALIERYKLEMTSFELKKNHLNKPRNSLKHNACNEERSIEIDPEIESINMLARALSNHVSLQLPVTETIKRGVEAVLCYNSAVESHDGNS